MSKHAMRFDDALNDALKNPEFKKEGDASEAQYWQYQFKEPRLQALRLLSFLCHV